MIRNGTNARGSPWTAHFAAAVLFTATAIFLTWPLALHINDALPGRGPGDNVMFLWNFWWARYALSSGWNLFHTLHLFYPFGTDLAVNTHTALNAIAGATVLAPLSVIAAQNVVIVASYVLNGVGAYTLAWTLTRSAEAAAAAGIMFMAAPFFAAHLHGHFNLLSAWFLPLYAAAILRALDRRSVRAAALAGAVLALGAYSDYYFVVFLAVFTACALAARWVAVLIHAEQSSRSFGAIDWGLVAAALIAVGAAVWIRATGGGALVVGDVTVSMRSDANLRSALWVVLAALAWRRWPIALRLRRLAEAPPRRDLLVIAVIVCVFIVGVAPLVSAGAGQWLRGDYVSQTYFWRSAPTGIDLLSLVAGNPFHPIWGGVTQRIYEAAGIEAIEHAAWLGLAPIAGVILSWRARSFTAGARFWAGVAGVFMIWALGPSLIVAGIRTGLWLPEVLVRFVPIVSNARMPGRAMVMVYLALAVMSALAIATLNGSRARWTAAALCGVALVDFAVAPFPLYRPEVPSFYRELADARRAALLELPLGLHDGLGAVGEIDPEALVFQTIHERPIFGGIVARLPPSVERNYEATPVLRALLQLSSGERVDELPTRDAVGAFLHDSKTAYVVVSLRLAPAALQDFVNHQMPVTLRRTELGRALYVVE